MISSALLEHYNLGPISKYWHTEREYYNAFLSVTDYVVTKAAEAMMLGESVEQYQEVLEARKYCREQINAIDAGTYDGPEAGTDIDVYYPPENDEPPVGIEIG